MIPIDTTSVICKCGEKHLAVKRRLPNGDVRFEWFCYSPPPIWERLTEGEFEALDLLCLAGQPLRQSDMEMVARRRRSAEVTELDREDSGGQVTPT